MAQFPHFYHNIILYSFPTILQSCMRSEIFQALNHGSSWPPEDCDAKTLKILMFTVRWYYKLSPWWSNLLSRMSLLWGTSYDCDDSVTVFPEHSSGSIIANPSTQLDVLPNVLLNKNVTEKLSKLYKEYREKTHRSWFGKTTQSSYIIRVSFKFNIGSCRLFHS